MKQIILNSDVGEEAGFDAQIMPYISWCNIACGGHAGNEKVIRETIDLAIKNGVKIGAHPSYPDRENFGRKHVDLRYQDLVSTVTDQIQLVKRYAEKAGGVLHHVKPHGALYNDAVLNDGVGNAIIHAIKNIDKRLYLITPKISRISSFCEEQLRLKYEVFADRNYNENLTLVSRQKLGAVITNPKEVFEHVYRMVVHGEVKTQKGVEMKVNFDTICVHGDNPNSVDILKFIHKEFSNRGYTF